MKLACCVWALTLSESEMLKQIKAIGFNWIDIQPHMLHSDESRSVANSLDLRVSCIGASFDMPADVSLDHLQEANRQQAINHVYQAIIHADDLGANCVYVVPGIDTSPAVLSLFASSLKNIADKASEYHIKMCVEHFPGRALGTASDTLAFITQINHSNLYLLLDSGHIQMSGEDSSDIILKAGSKLGYVHLDDNDGQNDLHESLLDGVMEMEDLKKIFKALRQIDYSGAISLELSAKLPSPKQSLMKSREIVMGLMEG
jgi:sugar phosphate isomerase/epimerase